MAQMFDWTIDVGVEVKAWGLRILLAEKDTYILNMCTAKEGQSSLHYHERKNNTITVISGLLEILLLRDDGTEDIIELGVGESIIIHAGLVHRFKVLVPNTKFFELDWCDNDCTPDDLDIYRLEEKVVGEEASH